MGMREKKSSISQNFGLESNQEDKDMFSREVKTMGS